MRARSAKAVPVLLAALALVLSAGACGSSDSGGKPVTLTIGSRATPEEEVLGHIYAGALRQAGYRVKGEFGLDPEYRETPIKELEAGRLSGFPERVDTALEDFLSVDTNGLPKKTVAAYKQIQAELEKRELTAFPPTPYSFNRQVGMLRSTARQHHLKTLSDLRGISEKMTLTGPTNCHFAADCLSGLERYYGVYFESISYTYTPQEIRRRFKVLEEGKYDASYVNNTDGQLAKSHKFVLLEDDKHILPAGNIVFITSADVVDEAGEDFEKTIVAVQKGLTVPVMQRLDAEVEFEKKDPAVVAAGYLEGL